MIKDRKLDRHLRINRSKLSQVLLRDLIRIEDQNKMCKSELIKDFNNQRQKNWYPILYRKCQDMDIMIAEVKRQVNWIRHLRKRLIKNNGGIDPFMYKNRDI